MLDLSSSFFVCLPGRVLITEPFPMTPPISWDKGRLSDFVSEFTGIARDLWRIAEVNRSPYRASENSPQSQIITQNLSYPIIILVLFHHVPMKIPIFHHHSCVFLASGSFSMVFCSSSTINRRSSERFSGKPGGARKKQSWGSMGVSLGNPQFPIINGHSTMAIPGS